VKRCLPVLLLVALAGCGSAAVPPAPKPVVPEEAHIRVVPKRTFVRRVNRICDDVGKVNIGPVPTLTSDVYRNRRVFGAWFGRVHTAVRRARQRFVSLGTPARDHARWARVISKIRAEESHLDTLRAATWSGSLDMLLLSARELRQADRSLSRRLRRFGVTHCE
jgi:hypothetical protein